MATKARTPRPVNIVRVFNDALAAGIVADDWYVIARREAAGMAERHGVTVEVAAGVIAAVSPLNSWGSNLALAERLLATRDFSRGYLTVGLTKARRIVEGAEPLDVLVSDKVANFYRSIVSEGRDGVCIDRHAWCIAVNKRMTEVRIGKAQYRAASASYVEATRRLNAEHGLDLTPAQVQSTTWVAWRRRYWSDGAFDPTS